jgi:hypothetical protein
MAGEHERESERRRADSLEGKEGVGGRAAEEGAGVGSAEAPREARGRLQAEEAEAGEEEGVARRRPAADGTKDVVEDFAGVLGERRHEIAVRLPVFAEARRGGVDGLFERRRRAVVEGMGDRGRRPGPFQTMLGERQGAQERRDDAHRMDGRADVVAEAGQGHLFGARAAADRGVPLEDDNGEAGLGQDDRRGQAVRAGADYDCVDGLSRFRVHPSSFIVRR